MFDGEAFGLEVVAAVKAHMDRTLVPILARLDGIEQRFDALPDTAGLVANEVSGLSEKFATRDETLRELKELRSALEAIGPVPELPDLAGMIADSVKPHQDAIAMLKSAIEDVCKSIPEPSETIELPAVELPNFPALIADEVHKAYGPLIDEAVQRAVSALPEPQPGKDADMDAVAVQVGETVERILEGWERPQNGKSVTVEELTPLVLETVQKAVSAIPVPKNGEPGRDGLDAVSFLIDKEGHLHVTMSNGTTKDLGPIHGKDGEPGKNGIDGLDGVGFDDMTCDIRDDGVYLMWEKGEVIKEARLPVPIDRGVWKEGSTYKRGECVTWGGSLFIAQEDTSDKPETGKSWRMAVKRGRDGKDKV